MKLFMKIFYSLVFLLLISTDLFFIYSSDTESGSSSSESSSNGSSSSESSGSESTEWLSRIAKEPASYYSDTLSSPPPSLPMATTEQTWKDANAKTSEYYVNKFKNKGCFDFKSLKFPRTIKIIKQRFYDLLKRMAKNPVGKVLCHLILEELDRKNSEIEEKLNRDWIKHLEISIHNWKYDVVHQRLNVFGGDVKIVLKGPPQLPNKPDSEEIYLFHEMLHWYHSLRNIEKYDDDIFYDFDDFIGSLERMIYNNQKDFSKIIENDPRRIEDISRTIALSCRDIEEWRTVFYNPDDRFGVTENLFRLMGGHKIRLRYNGKREGEKTVYPGEEGLIINQIISWAVETKEELEKNKIKFNYN